MNDRKPVTVTGKTRKWARGGQLVTERRVHLERAHAVAALFGRRGPRGERRAVDVSVVDGETTVRFVAPHQPDATDLKVLLAVLDLVAERHAVVPCEGDGGFAKERTRATRATLGEIARRAGLVGRLGGRDYQRLADRLDRLARVSVTFDTGDFHGTTSLLAWGGRKRGGRLGAKSETVVAPWPMLAKAATGENGTYVLVPLAEVAGLGALETLILVAARARVRSGEQRKAELETVLDWVEPAWRSMDVAARSEVRRAVVEALQKLAKRTKKTTDETTDETTGGGAYETVISLEGGQGKESVVITRKRRRAASRGEGEGKELPSWAVPKDIRALAASHGEDEDVVA